MDEAKIEQAALYDGHYAVITNNLTLDTKKANTIHGGLWNIEESSRIEKAICMLRYAQCLLEATKGTSRSASQTMDAIREPLALVQGIPKECGHTNVCITNIPRPFRSIETSPSSNQHDTDEISFCHKT